MSRHTPRHLMIEQEVGPVSRAFAAAYDEEMDMGDARAA